MYDHIPVILIKIQVVVEAWQIQAQTMGPIHSKCFWFSFQTSLPLVLVTGGCDGGKEKGYQRYLAMYRASHDH